MSRRSTATALIVVALLLSHLLTVAASPFGDRPLQSNNLRFGVASTASAAAESAPDAASAATSVEVVQVVTAKSLRQQDFAPILETSLFTNSDYSVYAWIYFRTGASSATIRLRWRWVEPDGTHFDEDSPWWTFATWGKATTWLELQAGDLPTGRWQVKYYVQVTEGGAWQYLSESIFFVNQRVACSELIGNGGFEGGSTGWSKSANAYIGTGKPHWGTQSAWLGGGNSGYYYLYRDVSLPAAAAGELSLAFYYNLFTNEGDSAAYDNYRLQIRDTSNNLLETLDTISNLTYYTRNPRDLWQPLTWDLSAYAGRTIRIWQEVSTDSSLSTTWYLDDFSVRKCTASVALKVAVILAEPQDETHDSKHNRAYYESLFQPVKSYHIENTMGRVALNLDVVYDNGGSWYKLNSKTHKEYAANPLEFVRQAEGLALGTTSIPRDTILVVVHAGDSAQTHPDNEKSDYITTATWPMPGSPNGNEIIVSEDDPVGLWAHEIGHDLGSLLVGSSAPDVYNMGNVGKWDVMASGSWNGGWLCNAAGSQPVQGLCTGSNPPHMSSYTKEFLQLLTYQRVDWPTSGSYWVDVLPRKQLGDSVLQYVVTVREDGTPEQYYIAEVRNSSNKYSQWDTSVPDSGLMLYWVDMQGAARYGDSGNNTRPDVNRVITTSLQTPGLFRTSEYLDADNLLRFKVVEERAQGTSYALRVEISTPAPDPTWLAGVILLPEGKVASDVAPWWPLAAPSLYLGLQPDLDLHVYTDDGRHVGMNYATGEYEVQVDGARVSGNLHNAHEWILLPQGVGFHYVVRSAATYRFLADNAGAAAYTDGKDGYRVYGLLSSPATGFVTSTLQQGTIDSGVDVEHPVAIGGGQTTIQVGAGTTRLLPVDLAVTGTAPELVSPGIVFTYSLTFGNSGGSAATGVSLHVRLPDNGDFVSAPGFVPAGANEYSYTIASMGVAQSLHVAVVMRARMGLRVGTMLPLLATVGDDGTHGADNVPANNQVTVTSYLSTRVFLPIVVREE